MVELLKQPQFQPLHFADQVFSIFAGTNGFFDKVPVNKVFEVEQEMIQFMREQKSEVRDAMVATGELDAAALKAALTEFAKTLEGRFEEE